MESKFPLGLTYDDVLLVPQYSDIRSRRDVSTRTRISRNIHINVPIVSSNMDSVTETDMATAIAREGGIGILHRFCSVEEQCRMVQVVKRAQSHHVVNPRTITPDASRQEILEAFAWTGRKGGVGSLMVVSPSRTLLGMITRADLELSSESCRVAEMMTPRERLVTTQSHDLRLEDAAQLMLKHRISDLPIVDSNFHLQGLITAADVRKLTKTSRSATLNSMGQLRVGAAIGVKRGDLERAAKLVEVGADLLVVDVAHGDSSLCISMVKALKSDPRTKHIDVVAGNVATAEGAQHLIEAGADGLKVGVGPGSICVTRLVAGSGYPQLSAIMETYKVAARANVPIIADGGIKSSGCIAKAIAAGADTVMLGSILAGVDESPGHILVKDGRKVKVVRGMAGVMSNVSKAIKEKNSADEVFETIVPEGVEGVVPSRGALTPLLHQLIGGLRSGMSYCGARTIAEMHAKAKFCRMTGAGLKESGSHDISKL